MPYLFTCPHCQTKTEVDDRYSGQAGTCVTCGGPIQIPRFAAGDTEPPKRPRAQPSTERLVRWFVAGSVGVVLVGALLTAVFRIGGETVGQLNLNRDRSASMQNLERIARALNAYAADYGTYPPSATQDSSGKKMHSWRVLILPYLGEDEIYNQFDLSVPWDSTRNLRAAVEMPACYRHPKQGSTVPYNGSAYFMIVGPATVQPASGPLATGEIGDEHAQTVLVIEGSPIVPSGMWTEPLDLDVTKMRGSLTTNPGIEPGGLLEGGVAFATIDGRAHFVPDTIEPGTMMSLITANGGERLPDDTLD